MFPNRSALAVAIVSTLIGSTAHADDLDVQAQLVEQGHYWQVHPNAQRSAEAWEKLLRINPQHPDALYGMGLIAVRQDKPEQARKYLVRLQALSPRPWLAAQLEQDIAMLAADKQEQLEQARRLADAGKRDEADKAFRQTLGDLTPEGQIGLEFYNNLAFTERGWPQARQGLERLVREMPDNSLAALVLAKQLNRHEDSRAEGIRMLGRLTQRTDIAGDADESWRLGLVWMGPPNSSQVPLFEDFLKAHPDDQEIRALMNKGKQSGGAVWTRDPQVARGLEALDKGDTKAAEDAFQARLKAKPGDPDALGGLGVVRQQQKRFSEAEQLLQQAIAKGGVRWQAALDDVRYWALLDQARQQQERGQTARAKELVLQAMKMNPNDPDGQLAMANIQVQAGEFEAAESNYRRVLATRRNDAQATRGLINVMAQTGRADEALRLFDSLSPSERQAMGDAGKLRALRAAQVGKLAEERGDVAAAMKAYNDALKDDPDSTWTRFALARLYLQNGEPRKAQDLVDTLVKAHPDNAEALYVSALLSAEMEQWPAAQATMKRIPPAKRTADMTKLADLISLNTQVDTARTVARRGQRQEALALLDRLKPSVGSDPAKMVVLASAVADAGEPEEAESMMRSVMTRSGTPSDDLMLQYAAVLLKTGNDEQVNTILRSLQNKPLSGTTRSRYDNVLQQYRIRQADQLREAGDLAAAYDVLSPALAKRPGDVGATSALARLYSANGDDAKALELYKPLLKRKPDDPQILLSAASAAVQAHDYGFAEQALDQFFALQIQDPQMLTDAAGIYRAMGKTGKATEVLRQAVAIERSERDRVAGAQSRMLNVEQNPFGARRNEVAVASAQDIPPTAQDILDKRKGGGTSRRSQEAYEAASLDDVMAAGPSRRKPSTRAPASAGNPFGARQRELSEPEEQRTAAQRALDGIMQERSGYVAQGLSVRNNDSESGLGKMTDVQTPFEAAMPIGAGDNRIALRITPVALSAGSVKASGASRFGSGSTETEGIGRQRDTGVGVSVAYSQPDDGFKADLGTTPIGFKYATVASGVSVERPLASNNDVRYGVTLSRRPVIDSLTSFAGTTDHRDGRSWGGVTANGGRAQLSYDNSRYGAYGYGALHKLLGNNVESNTRGELGGGVYWYLVNATDSTLTLGLSSTILAYENNQDFYTYGHGGYFSPQSFYALGVPLTWAQRTERFTYKVRGSVGVQHFKQDGADYFPNDSALQQADGRRYSGNSKTGVGYSLAAAGEYKLGAHFLVGGELGVDNSRDYTEFNGNMYMRYMFEEMNGPMALPVSPFRSPYSN